MSELELLDTNNVKDLFRKGKEHTYFQLIQGTGSEMTVQFEEPFKNVVSVEVVHARVPFTEYSIEADRRDIILVYGDGDTKHKHTISMPVKDYSNVDIYEEFNDLAAAQGDPDDLSTHPLLPIRMGEEDDTGIFFFYDTNSTGDRQDWNIEITTTCLIPIGLGQTFLSTALAVQKNNEVDSGGIAIGGEIINGETYYGVLRSPYRYDLVVSDVLYLNCPE